jgi:AraC-like DNA-binding protein
MKSMISEAATSQLSGSYEFRLRENPDDVYGLQFSLHTRIFIFETPGALLHTDFVAQEMTQDTMYIIPPLHFHHLKEHGTGNFICIDIDNILLSPYHKQLLYSIKYSLQKSLPALPHTTDDCTYSNLKALNFSLLGKQILMEKLSRWIGNRITTPDHHQRRSYNYAHIEIAEQLLTLLTHKSLTTDTCKVAAIASELYHSERALHRICMNAFGLCVKDILNYHLVVKGIYLLARYTKSISEIAHELSFSNVTAFGRYIKRKTGYTASEIREVLFSAGIKCPSLHTPENCF